MNLYQAFNQNPVNFIDPLGTKLRRIKVALNIIYEENAFTREEIDVIEAMVREAEQFYGRLGIDFEKRYSKLQSHEFFFGEKELRKREIHVFFTKRYDIYYKPGAKVEDKVGIIIMPLAFSTKGILIHELSHIFATLFQRVGVFSRDL